MKFELTFDNGTKKQVHAKDWAELMRPGNTDPEGLMKVEVMDKRIITFNVRAINDALHDAGRRYWKGEAIRNYIKDTLEVHGFEIPEDCDWEETFQGQEGERRVVPIGLGTYLCVTWYRMTSGNYEVVAYIS